MKTLYEYIFPFGVPWDDFSGTTHPDYSKRSGWRYFIKSLIKNTFRINPYTMSPDARRRMANMIKGTSAAFLLQGRPTWQEQLRRQERWEGSRLGQMAALYTAEKERAEKAEALNETYKQEMIAIKEKLSQLQRSKK